MSRRRVRGHRERGRRSGTAPTHDAFPARARRAPYARRSPTTDSLDVPQPSEHGPSLANSDGRARASRLNLVCRSRDKRDLSRGVITQTYIQIVLRVDPESPAKRMPQGVHAPRLAASPLTSTRKESKWRTSDSTSRTR